MSVNAINAALLKTSSDIAAVESDISTAQSDISTLQSAAGPGLVFISRTTIGNDVTSVTVSNAFSADYDNYRIIVTSTASGGPDTLGMQLGNYTSNDYRYHYRQMSYFSSTPSSSNSFSFNQWPVGYVNNEHMCRIDVYMPYLAVETMAEWFSSADETVRYGGGWHFQEKSVSSFRLFTAQAGMVGGYIDVYGYAKA